MLLQDIRWILGTQEKMSLHRVVDPCTASFIILFVAVDLRSGVSLLAYRYPGFEGLAAGS